MEHIKIERYCRKCGKQLVAARRRKKIFNPWTGEQELYLLVACPAIIDNSYFRWWHEFRIYTDSELPRLQEKYSFEGIPERVQRGSDE